MKKIGYYIIFVIVMMIAIPLIILGGIGPGIKIPGIINKFPNVSGDIKYNTDNGGPIIRVYVSKQDKIVEMYFEDYIRGVVSAEMPAEFSVEALKAQAIAARTFAAGNMKIFGRSGCAKHPGADVCSDVHCQAWISKDDRLKGWEAKKAPEYWAKITRAVEETKGQIITYKGSLAGRIKYHSSSSGKTENSQYVFNYSEPYLVSVDSPDEETTPKLKTIVIMTKKEFIKRVLDLAPSTKISEKNLSSQIKILSLTDGDRVEKIKIGDKIFTGIDIRWAMGLNSASFMLTVDTKNVTFNVRGNGHGVGMSQWGANTMGKLGKSYKEILQHYYKGVEISNMKDIFKE